MNLEIWYNGPVPWVPAGMASHVQLRPTWQPSDQDQRHHPDGLVDLEAHSLEPTSLLKFRHTGKSVYVSPTLALNTDTMRAVTTVFNKVFLCINGLTIGNIESIRDQMTGNTLVPTYNMAGCDSLECIEMLSWLQAHVDTFAVMGDHEDGLAMAVAFGAQTLLIGSNRTIDLSWPLRIWRTRTTDGSHPPVRPVERDLLEDRSTCLVANCFCQAGTTIEPGMISEQIAKVRGISSAYLENIIGKKVRYDLSPGDPITFGHLCGEKTECLIRKCL